MLGGVLETRAGGARGDTDASNLDRPSAAEVLQVIILDIGTNQEQSAAIQLVVKAAVE
jgi:hypothetical protein